MAAQPAAEYVGAAGSGEQPRRADRQQPGRTGQQRDRADARAAAAPASSRASSTTVEMTPPASTAHTPGPVPAPWRRYSRTCQAPPVTGPAGITLASPVDASTRPNTVRHRNDAPPAASSWRCAAVPPASVTPCAATTTPSQANRSPPRWAAAARTSPAAPGGADRSRRQHARCQHPRPGPATAGSRPRPTAGEHRARSTGVSQGCAASGWPAAGTPVPGRAPPVITVPAAWSPVSRGAPAPGEPTGYPAVV